MQPPFNPQRISNKFNGNSGNYFISCQAAALRACTSDCWRLDRSVNLHHKRFHWAKQKAIVCVSTQVPPVGHSSWLWISLNIQIMDFFFNIQRMNYLTIDKESSCLCTTAGPIRISSTIHLPLLLLWNNLKVLVFHETRSLELSVPRPLFGSFSACGKGASCYFCTSQVASTFHQICKRATDRPCCLIAQSSVRSW